MSGFFVALGTLLLLSALGLVIGFTAVENPRAVTGETASELGIGAGIWTFLTVLIASFLGAWLQPR